MDDICIGAEYAGKENNATPAVLRALGRLGESGGGVLRFEKGEYHFFEAGAAQRFFAVSNNSTGLKKIVFFLDGLSGVTVDGNGSVFVFHELAFPVVIEKCRHVTLKNIIFDRAFYPQAILEVAEVRQDGFRLRIDPQKNPYRVRDGALLFDREWGCYSGLEKIFSLHATGDRFHVQYLITGDCAESSEHLPATFVRADAEETADGVFFRYRNENRYALEYAEGDVITSILDGRRDIDVVLIDRSGDVTLSDITVRRGVGMGVIGQLSRDLEIDGFSTDCDFHGEYSSLTADALHFVHCSGRLNIHGCRIEKTSDDAVNVHGMYTVVEQTGAGTIRARIMHREQQGFLPYEKGDRLELLDPDTYRTVSEFYAEDAGFEDDRGEHVKIQGRFTQGAAGVRPGCLVEIPDKMPELHLYGNVFNLFPHLRVSGAGRMLIEDNRFSNCGAALLAQDNAKYWYESGRIKNLVFRRNRMDGCNRLMGENFIFVGVDGRAPETCPKIHDRVEISGNRFINIKKRAIFAYAVRHLVLKDNLYENRTEELIVVDGKVQKSENSAD